MRTNDDNLREVDSISSDVVESVLKLVHDGDEVAIHRHGGQIYRVARELMGGVRGRCAQEQRLQSDLSLGKKQSARGG